MVDPERLKGILQDISGRITELRDYRNMDRSEILGNQERLYAILYLFRTAIEGCIDAAHHVCASEGWGDPKDNAGAMRLLAARGALGRELSDRMASAIQFRNIVVHLYRDVEPERALGHLDQLEDLERFIEAIATLVEET